MKKNNFIWIPRILGIAYILFISLFALDTEFGVGFLIHLIPTAIFLAILIATWKFPKIAGVLFGIAGIVTIIAFNTYRELITFLLISIIPIAIGILFFFQKKPKH